jgi:hypothetical protein
LKRRVFLSLGCFNPSGIRAKKMRQNKNLEPRSDSIGTGKALAQSMWGGVSSCFETPPH